MDIEQIIQQTEQLTSEEQKKLAIYLFVKFITPDHAQLLQLIIGEDGLLSSQSTTSRKLNHAGAVHLGGSLDDVNVRDFAYAEVTEIINYHKEK